MKPARFDYAAPSTVQEAVSLLAQNEFDETKVLAGGQSLMPLLNMRLARPTLLVDISGLRDLDYVRERPGGLAIGAAVTKRTIEDSALVRARHPLFHAATVRIGHPQIRNRGTVGGSMAQADPAAEYPAAAVILGMELVALGPGGERCIRAEDFFVTYLTTALESNELLVEVRVPELAAGTGWSFQEVARRHGDFAMAGATATLRVEGGVCVDPRIVVFAVGDRPVRVPEAESMLAGEVPSPELFSRAAAKLPEVLDEPTSDHHASAEYRLDLARVLTERALIEAAERAVGGSPRD